MRSKKGQSVLEYVIVLTAIVAAVIFAAGKFIKPAVEQAMSDSATSIKSATAKLPGATPTPPPTPE